MARRAAGNAMTRSSFPLHAAQFRKLLADAQCDVRSVGNGASIRAARSACPRARRPPTCSPPYDMQDCVSKILCGLRISIRPRRTAPVADQLHPSALLLGATKGLRHELSLRDFVEAPSAPPNASACVFVCLRLFALPCAAFRCFRAHPHHH
jgi:hypothetical protein